MYWVYNNYYLICIFQHKENLNISGVPLVFPPYSSPPLVWPDFQTRGGLKHLLRSWPRSEILTNLTSFLIENLRFRGVFDEKTSIFFSPAARSCQKSSKSCIKRAAGAKILGYFRDILTEILNPPLFDPIFKQGGETKGTPLMSAKNVRIRRPHDLSGRSNARAPLRPLALPV